MATAVAHVSVGPGTRIVADCCSEIGTWSEERPMERRVVVLAHLKQSATTWAQTAAHVGILGSFVV